jgi:hypothetical protein
VTDKENLKSLETAIAPHLPALRDAVGNGIKLTVPGGAVIAIQPEFIQSADLKTHASRVDVLELLFQFTDGMLA